MVRRPGAKLHWADISFPKGNLQELHDGTRNEELHERGWERDPRFEIDAFHSEIKVQAVSDVT